MSQTFDDTPENFMMRLNSRSVQIFSVVSIIATLAFWHFRTTGQFSLPALGTFALFTFACLAYGDAFLRVTENLMKNQAGLAFQFLSGFFLFNTFLFVLSLASTFGILINVTILSIGALLLVIFGFKRQASASSVDTSLSSLICILISSVAATLWCSDSQTPLVINGQTAIYQTWQDTFFHVRVISVFAQAHGLWTIQDIRMSGVPAPVYHYASYQAAAAVSTLAGIPAIDVYSSFQLPLGIFLTGLAAFSLIASIWGGWPALAAVAAVTLFPDAYQQGFANRYLSYNFLAQVNLGLLYGISCAALSWIFVLEGSRRGKLALLLVGYFFLGICLFYKAHIFVANSLLLLIYPWLFFNGLKLRWRTTVVSILTGIFILVIEFSQTIDRIPVIRMDGSGIGRYVVVLLESFDSGFLQSFFTRIFIEEHHSKPLQGLYTIAMLLLSTFGVLLAATPVVAIAGRNKTTALVLFFPVAITINYLMMSIWLALDTRGIGTPDELLNRPLVWAYFAVVAWTAGFGYYLAIGSRLPKSRMVQSILLILLCSAVVSTSFFSKNLQTFPARQGFVKYSEFNQMPVCLVRASQYIKDNSHPNEIIQDSQNDPRFIVTALTERQRFAGISIFGKSDKELQERLTVLLKFKELSNTDTLKSYADLHNISWYLLHPSTSVSWPISFLQTHVFNCDGFRVYHFYNKSNLN